MASLCDTICTAACSSASFLEAVASLSPPPPPPDQLRFDEVGRLLQRDVNVIRRQLLQPTQAALAPAPLSAPMRQLHVFLSNARLAATRFVDAIGAGEASRAANSTSHSKAWERALAAVSTPNNQSEVWSRVVGVADFLRDLDSHHRHGSSPTISVAAKGQAKPTRPSRPSQPSHPSHPSQREPLQRQRLWQRLRWQSCPPLHGFGHGGDDGAGRGGNRTGRGGPGRPAAPSRPLHLPQLHPRPFISVLSGEDAFHNAPGCGLPAAFAFYQNFKFLVSDNFNIWFPKGFPFFGPGNMGILSLNHDGTWVEQSVEGRIKAMKQLCRSDPLLSIGIPLIYILVTLAYIVAWALLMVAGALELLVFWVMNPWWDLCMLIFFAIANALWQHCGWMCSWRAGIRIDDDDIGDDIAQQDDGTACTQKHKEHKSSCGCADAPFSPPPPRMVERRRDT